MKLYTLYQGLQLLPYLKGVVFNIAVVCIIFSEVVYISVLLFMCCLAVYVGVHVLQSWPDVIKLPYFNTMKPKKQYR